MVQPNEPTGYETYSSEELSDNIAHEIIAGLSYDAPKTQSIFLDEAARMNEELRRRGVQ